MNITPISLRNYQLTNPKNDYPNKTINKSNNFTISNMPNHYYGPSFGYCEGHTHLMKTLNGKFANAIKTVFEEYEKVLGEAAKSHSKLKVSDDGHKLATQMLAQYTNYQYSMAEVIPSYAMETAPEVAAALSKIKAFSNPVDIMLNISNIPKLQTKVGIDKNTQKMYTAEQSRKSRANTQLYSTIMLIEMLDKNIAISNLNTKSKDMISELRASALDSISKIYGEDVFDRIQVLKKMGLNASNDDKKKSLALVKEFDEKAQELKFSDDFNKKLEELINYQNTIENRTVETQVDIPISIPVVTLKYHTHPQKLENIVPVDTQKHSRERTVDDPHSHEYMHEHGMEHAHNVETEN